MSVESETWYRLQCSGSCGMWLRSWPDGYSNPTPYMDAAVVFKSWEAANEGGAEAGWFDGPQGEYAKCDCGSKALLVARHVANCRLNRPRLVPLCPPCRTAEENPPESEELKVRLVTIAGDPLVCEYGHQVSMQIEVKEE